MKKSIVLLLLLSLLLGSFTGCAAQETPAEPSPEPSAGLEAVPEITPEPIQIRSVDYESLYALHQPEEVVAEVDGNEITWGDYFYFLVLNSEEMASQFAMMANYYGIAMDWTDPIGEDPEETYASLIPSYVETTLIQLMTIKGFARENGVELSPESQESIQAQLENDILTFCGEDGTEEDLNAHLQGNRLPRSLYDDINRINHLYQDNFRKIYGADAELASDADALEYLEAGNYVAADHILLMTVDQTSQEPLEADLLQEKKAQAQAIVDELQAIGDKDERIARFKELKDEYTEDGGAAVYLDGYTFTSGKMVQEFEDGTRALKEYEISGIVESSYGYHIILRLPLDPDGLVEFSSQGTPLTGRKLFANEDYARLLTEYAETVKVEYREGFEQPDILPFLKDSQ